MHIITTLDEVRVEDYLRLAGSLSQQRGELEGLTTVVLTGDVTAESADTLATHADRVESFREFEMYKQLHPHWKAIGHPLGKFAKLFFALAYIVSNNVDDVVVFLDPDTYVQWHLAAFETPAGPGLRVDTFGYVGYTPSPRFDSLLAKLVAHSPSNNFADAVNRAYRGLCEFRIEGVSTNLPFLLNLLKHPEFGNGAVYTGFIDEHIEELTAANDSHQRLYFNDRTTKESVSPGLAGAKVDTLDPLAIRNHGKPGNAGPKDSVAPPTAPPRFMPPGATRRRWVRRVGGGTTCGWMTPR